MSEIESHLRWWQVLLICAFPGGIMLIGALFITAIYLEFNGHRGRHRRPGGLGWRVGVHRE